MKNDILSAAGPAAVDARLAEHAGTDGQLAETLEQLRQAYAVTHWTDQEGHTVAIAVRVLRELDIWRRARAAAGERDAPAAPVAWIISQHGRTDSVTLHPKEAQAWREMGADVTPLFVAAGTAPADARVTHSSQTVAGRFGPFTVAVGGQTPAREA